MKNDPQQLEERCSYVKPQTLTILPKRRSSQKVVWVSTMQQGHPLLLLVFFLSWKPPMQSLQNLWRHSVENKCDSWRNAKHNIHLKWVWSFWSDLRNRLACDEAEITKSVCEASIADSWAISDSSVIYKIRCLHLKIIVSQWSIETKTSRIKLKFTHS